MGAEKKSVEIIASAGKDVSVAAICFFFSPPK